MEIFINDLCKKVEGKCEKVPLYTLVKINPWDEREIPVIKSIKKIIYLNNEQVDYEEIPEICLINDHIRCYKGPLQKDGTFKLIQI